MFGHQDDKKHDDEHEEVVAPDQPAADQGQDQGQADAAPQQDAGDDSAAPAGDDGAWQHPGTPLSDDDGGDDGDAGQSKGPEPINDIVGGSNAGPGFKPYSQHDDGDDGDAAPAPSLSDGDTANTPHELIDVKQKALNDLSPLVGKLDLSPEDRFRTIMMMIQASDDQSLVQDAYEAAHAIEDEKARAQALLDIVNEINYFTQHPEN